MERKKTLEAIDIAKLIFCIGIVAIHTAGLKDLFDEKTYWYIEKLLFRLGVPFFFITSGYFIGKKIYTNPRYLKDVIFKYIKRLFVPLIVFEIVNILLRLLVTFIEGGSLEHTLYMALRSVIFYPYGALWYVQASIFAIIFLYYFIDRNKMNLALIIGTFLYLIGLLANSYYFLIENTILSKWVDFYLEEATSMRNAVFIGFLFLGIGIWLSKKIIADNVSNIKKKSLISLILSIFIYILELKFIYGRTFADGDDYYIMLPVVAASLFAFLTTLNLRIPLNISIISRKLSTGIFYLHSPMMLLFKIVGLITGIIISPFMQFISILLICIIVLPGIYNKKIEPLNKLLS